MKICCHLATEQKKDEKRGGSVERTDEKSDDEDTEPGFVGHGGTFFHKGHEMWLFGLKK